MKDLFNNLSIYSDSYISSFCKTYERKGIPLSFEAKQFEN
jgi:hypothetical protein